MEKKIVFSILCMLVIAGPVVSVAGTTIQDDINSRETTKNYGGSIQQITGKNCVMAGWSEIAKLIASDGATSDWFGYSVSISGDYAIAGAWYDDNSNGADAGAAYIFKRSGTSWMQEAKLTASDGAASDWFGCSVSLNGDYAVIGAYSDDTSSGSNAGSAYVFKRSGTSWTQEAKLTASDGAAYDYFGYSVSISGDYAIAGANGDNNGNGADAGAAYIFKRSGTSWTQEAKLIASDGAAGDCFGCSVSISGDYAIAGAWYDDNSNGANAGSAYIFKRSGTSWTQEAKLIASDGAAGDCFGCSVSISGDYAIAGANGDDNGNGADAGAAYIFKRSGTSWTQEAKLIASDGAAGDYFGDSVSISGDYAIAGAPGDDNGNGADAGAAYIFKRSGTSWKQEAKLIASDGAAYDAFGNSVSISGYYTVIGAFQDDNVYGNDAGSAYIFKRPIPDLDCSGTLSWTDVNPGETVSGQFLVANIGEPTSTLSWKIDLYPDWGTWSFTPSSGSGLTPEMGAITVGVEVTAPDQQNQQFTGEIKIVNSEDSNDYDTISVSLKTPVNQQSGNPQLLPFLMMRQNSMLGQLFMSSLISTRIQNLK